MKIGEVVWLDARAKEPQEMMKTRTVVQIGLAYKDGEVVVA